MAVRRDSDEALLRELRAMMPKLRGLVDEYDYRQSRERMFGQWFASGRTVAAGLLLVTMLILNSISVYFAIRGGRP